jgi:hypothetical protein
LASLCALAAPCHAEWSNLCDRQARFTASEQDKLYRFAAIVKDELAQSGQRLALIARSGLDLQRFGLRYSHAGISLLASENTPWSVRQLYYACDERQPKVFDQGISGFMLGTSQPALGYVSVLLLPPAPAAELERAALSKQQALQVLGAHYSANAYPLSERYQNCNQWLIELLATAWGALPVEPVPSDHVDVDQATQTQARQTGQASSPSPAEPPLPAPTPRAAAQRWLQAQGYEPTVVDVGWRVLMWAGAFIPFVHSDDHPALDTSQQRYRVTMPASIEAFVQRTQPGATRIEFCHTDQHVVVHRGWDAIAEGCVPGEQDTVIRLD